MTPVVAAVSEVVAPLAVLVAALVVMVVTLLVSRGERRADGAKAVRGRNGSIESWRAEHGPAVDEWLDAYRARFAGLADALAGRAPIVVPEPVARELEDRLEAAAEASPDLLLGERLRVMQLSAQSALVATVANRIAAAADLYERYLSEREAALGRLGDLLEDPLLVSSP